MGVSSNASSCKGMSWVLLEGWAGFSLCVSSFGNGWRMAEFHDGSLGSQGVGWALWAYGNLTTGQRFWVANNDQWANPWNR